MRRIPFILALGAALLAIGVCDAESRAPYVGLFTDGYHSDCDVYLVGPFMPFEIWIWWYAGEDGLAATMHELVFPSNVLHVTETQSPECIVALGCECSLSNPAYCCQRVSCATGWAWSHHISCYLTDANPSWIEIVPCPGQPLVAASCAPGYPLEEVTVLYDLGLNQMCLWATEPLSWGSIKGLYR